MIDVNTEDTSMLSPRGIERVRIGIPRGFQSDDLIKSHPDSSIKGDSELHRSLLPGFGTAQGRIQN